jgi:hypothetical protein
MDRIRACYQQACLRYVSNSFIAKASLRERFSIASKNYSKVSRIISDVIKKKMVRRYDLESLSKNKSNMFLAGHNSYDTCRLLADIFLNNRTWQKLCLQIIGFFLIFFYVTVM